MDDDVRSDPQPVACKSLLIFLLDDCALRENVIGDRLAQHHEELALERSLILKESRMLDPRQSFLDMS
ncbi:hypothetical protein D3C85_1671780 [compost metagenome]